MALRRILAYCLLLTAPCFSQGSGSCSLTQSVERSHTGEEVGFAVSCPTSDIQINWELGDGTRFDTTQNIIYHTYSKAAHYLVVARIKGYSGIANAPHTVYDTVTTVAPTHSTTIIYQAKERKIFVVNADQNSISALDIVTQKKLWEMPVGKKPRTLAQDKNGVIWVVCQDDATLTLVDPLKGKLLQTITLPYASRPYGIAMVPGKNTVAVTLEATGKLILIDAESKKVVESLNLNLHPRPLAIAENGNIFVGRFISPEEHGEVVLVTQNPLQVKSIIPIAFDPGPDNEGNSRGVPNALNDIAITPDGHYAWVASKKDNMARGRFREGKDLTFESTVRSITRQICTDSNREDLSRRKDYNNQGIASAITFTQFGDYTFIAQSTSNNVAVVDTWSGDNVFSLESKGSENNLTPEGLVLDEKDSLLYVHYFLSRSVGVWDVSQIGKNLTMVKQIASISNVENEALSPEVLKGKKIFYNSADDRMDQDRYISCVVCHMDGGSDQRVWDFTQRGEGLRRTTSLLGKGGIRQGPLHWSANFDEIQDFEHDIRGQNGGKGFMDDADFNSGTHNKPLGDKKAGLSPSLDELSAYVTSLTTFHPSPYRNAVGSLTQDGVAGKQIFNRTNVGCAQCHSGNEFTDSKLQPELDKKVAGVIVTPGGFLVHDVGTIGSDAGKRLNDSLKGFDTPTLKGIWEFSPYLHDGSAATLIDVLTTKNKNDQHGHTSQLTATELNQLVSYLNQIDDLESPSLKIRAANQSRIPKKKQGDFLNGKILYQFQETPEQEASRYNVRGVQSPKNILKK